MPTAKNLVQETEKFFNHYWNISKEEPPFWSERWDFNSSIPNNEKRGCYALFNGQELIYIGVGIGKSFGKYLGSGLGVRLKRYWKVNKDQNSDVKYMPTDDWLELTSLMTIGFEEKDYPLAAALEIYLINKLNPLRNSKHK